MEHRGYTWKEFKESMEEEGIQDSSIISWEIIIRWWSPPSLYPKYIARIGHPIEDNTSASERKIRFWKRILSRFELKQRSESIRKIE